jgi:PAS domain S-box-containing protein
VSGAGKATRQPAYLAARRGERLWFAASIAIATAIFTIDAITGHDLRLVGFLFAAPFAAAAGARPLLTAIAGAYAVALAVIVGVPDDFFGSLDHIGRVGVVALGGAMAVGLSLVRVRAVTARRRYRLLAEAGRIAESSLDSELMLIQMAHLVSLQLADWCFVTLSDGRGGVRPVAAMHFDGERQRLAWELLARYPIEPHREYGAAAAIRESKAQLLAEVDGDALRRWAADDDHLRMLEQLRMRSLMVVPLIARGRTLGAMNIASAESGQVFGQDDLSLAVELADRMAVAVDNTRLYAELSDAEAGLRGSRDELQAILDGVADAITVQRPDGQLVYANDAAVRSMGFSSVEELLSTPVREIIGRFEYLDEDGQPVPMEKLPGRRALAGDPSPEPMLVRFRAHDDPVTRWTRIKATPVFGEDGNPLLAINVLEDMTEVREAHEGQRFLAEASAILASSLDYETTLANVARLAVPRVADWCGVDVLDEDGDIRHVVVAHTDPAKVDMAVEHQRRYPVDPNSETGVPNVLRTGEPEVYREISDEMLREGAQDEEQLEMLRELGMKSVMIVPMAARGRMLGVLTFVSAEMGRQFEDRDLMFAQELAGRCALAVDNSRLYGERAHIARTLQQSLLPPELPQPPGIEVAARFRAAGEGFEVGGDFYDVFDTGSSGWAAVIGDVCGKGPEAAAVTALARYTLRAAAMRDRVPSRILATLNEAMLRQRDDRRFCTVLYACVDRTPNGVQLRFSSGGHPLPLIVRANGDVTEIGTPGTLLGIVPDPDLYDEVVELQPGDAAILYTDGVTDAAAPEVLREPLDLAGQMDVHGDESADDLAQRLLDAALSGERTGEPRDDIAIVVIKARSASSLEADGGARAIAGAPA